MRCVNSSSIIHRLGNDSTMRPPISACIITFNEEKNIEACLESISWVEEIIVVDSMSNDRTIELCSKHTEKVYQKEWQGHVKQKNHALDIAQNEWVLCLDADERVSPGLRREIEECLSGKKQAADGYFFPRHSFYLGRWINHGGWYPDYKLRLFRKSKGRWGGKDPHDRVMLDGSSAYLKSDLLHYVYRNLSHQLQTVDNFSAITATIMDAEGERFSAAQLVFRPVLKFLGTYFIKRGFLDGMPGLVISVVSSFYVFLRYAKLWELQHLGKDGQSSRGTR
jgi:glycosyltransferase involved in cell wall biosynthesis